MKRELDWDRTTGKIKRSFTKKWANSGFINMEKLPDIITALIGERKIMVEYIEALHDKIDDIITKNNICDVPACHRANCTSDHK